MRSASKALIEGNIASVGSAHPFKQRRSAARFFGNETTAGQFVPGYDEDVSRTVDGLESSIQDSLAAAFL